MTTPGPQGSPLRGAIKEATALDWSRLNLRGGFTATVALSLVIVFVGALGDVAIAAGLAALFVVAGGPADTKRPDASTGLLIVVGALMTWLVSLSADSAVAATCALAVITLLVTVLSLRGQRATTMGVFTLLWAVVALMLGSPAEAISLSAAFAIGGVVAALAMWLASLSEDTAMGTIEGPGPDGGVSTGDLTPDAAGAARSLSAARDAVVKFAIVRSLAVGACVFLGYVWFPDHRVWAVLTFVLVVKPPPRQAVVTSLARALGTALGVGLGLVVTYLADGSLLYLGVAFVAAAYLMLATGTVNYALSTVFTTVVLIVSAAMLDGQAVTTGWQRLLATLLGVGVALLAIAVMRAITDHTDYPSPPEPTSQ